MPQEPLSVNRHPRTFESNRYVYLVLSRRSHGISIGINLNPDKICNFDCVYCQVDRAVPPSQRDVDEEILKRELEAILERVKDGSLFREPRFAKVPAAMRRVSDIAFSGDGEPTTYPRFREIVAFLVSLKRRLSLEDLKVTVLTNGTVLHRPDVGEALRLLDRSHGEIWIKLDAGTEAYYEQICVPGGTRFDKVLENILQAARARPVVIQSLFLRLDGAPPLDTEIEAFCARLNSIVEKGGKIRLVQVYTVARRPAQKSVTPLSDAEVDGIAEKVRKATGLPVEATYGSQDS